MVEMADECSGNFEFQKGVWSKEHLILRAIEARRKAYAPYSNYKVGAALLTRSGLVYTGCNIENISYSLCICAERTALFKAVSEGIYSKGCFVAIAVVTENGGSPCGACRQTLYEFGDDIVVLISDIYSYREVLLRDLLPDSFKF